MSATVAIVWPCRWSVEAYAAAGRGVQVPRAACPGCGRAMGWWSGYARYLRAGRVHRIWVRRARCRPCRVTHALLPSFSLLRRLDVVEVIGSALERVLAGAGVRPVASTLDVPHTTVRDWRRRFRARAPVLVAGLAALAIELGAPATTKRVAGAEAVALGTLGVVWGRVRHRLGPAAPGRWQLAALVSGGAWLASTTRPPWAGLAGRRWMPPVPDPHQQEALWHRLNRPPPAGSTHPGGPRLSRCCATG